MSAPRTIIIGDVHGCWTELQDLLRKTGATPGDRLISVGDLICKGPDTRQVLDWAMTAQNLTTIMGNHEKRLLDGLKDGISMKSCEEATAKNLGSNLGRYVKFIESWPYYFQAEDFLVVHAGIDPRKKSLKDQNRDELVNLRTLSGTGEPWFERYDGKQLIVFGHWAAQGVVTRPNAIGLDSGCVYGGSLTAVILPERRLVSVPARKVYAQKK
jgi:hypothetical protein